MEADDIQVINKLQPEQVACLYNNFSNFVVELESSSSSTLARTGKQRAAIPSTAEGGRRVPEGTGLLHRVAAVPPNYWVADSLVGSPYRVKASPRNLELG